jgi:hypothetical protein
MIDAAFWFAVLFGLVAALSGNRTAWPLLASAAFSYGLDMAGVSFDWIWWLLIDFAVIAAIILPLAARPSKADIAILALFLPAWGFYAAPDPWRFWGATSVVIAQLLLTFPAANAWRRIKQVNSDFNPWDHFNLRARHEDAT